SRLNRLIERVIKAYEEYTFHTIYHSIHNFCTVDLSALYLDIVKDRIYVEKKDALKRRASQTVIYETLMSLVKIISPILSTTSEEMWQYLKGKDDPESIFLCDFPQAKKELIDLSLEEEWEKIWKIREIVNKKIEEKRSEKILGHPLDAKVTIQAKDEDYRILTKLGDEIKDIFIVSQVFIETHSETIITVSRADGKKCQRCWQYSVDLTPPHARFPEVCKRCEDILSSL
ncbi:MAG TPA: class I tRNA ligase family protein, partial [Syntrophorhabdaceae bacterium]|nr:class I tRNA ligase family protein [Syntrophorhabdaceae bacterium]